MKNHLFSIAFILAALPISPAVHAAGTNDALTSQKYGPAPAYDPARGTYVYSDAPNAVSVAKNPNAQAYKYTKQYQTAGTKQQAKVDAAVAAHQAILGQIRKTTKTGNSSGPVTAGALH